MNIQQKRVSSLYWYLYLQIPYDLIEIFYTVKFQGGASLTARIFFIFSAHLSWFWYKSWRAQDHKEKPFFNKRSTNSTRQEHNRRPWRLKKMIFVILILAPREPFTPPETSLRSVNHCVALLYSTLTTTGNQIMNKFSYNSNVIWGKMRL